MEGATSKAGPVSWGLRAAAAVALIAVLTPPVLVLMVLLLPFRLLRIQLGTAYGNLLGLWVGRALGFRYAVSGRERLAGCMPAIYVVNHSSSLDLLVGLALVPRKACAVAKKEIARVPLFGQAYLLSGHLLIDRGQRDKAVAAMEATAEDVRRRGLGAWIWPEGTRSDDGRLKPFKKGFVHLAVATRLPVVPVVIHGAPRRWPARTFDLHPGTLQVEVLEPIATDGWSGDRAAEHAEQVHAVFAARLPEWQRPSRVGGVAPPGV